MKKTSFTLAELAKLTDSKVIGNPDYVITGFADLESAKPCDVSFLSNPRFVPTRYLNAMKSSIAGAIFIAPSVQPVEGKNYLIAEDPSRAFQQAIEAMRGPIKQSMFSGIHPSAVIHETAKIGKNVSVGPNAVIDGESTVGDNSVIGSNSYIGPYTTIGDDCIIHPNVTIRECCRLGNRVIVQPGAAIGTCGFGYTTNQKGQHIKLNHIGNVDIEDDVEIGGNTVIDRARFTCTIIARGTKIDNLVTIAHNVKLGPHNIVCGQSGIAGSTQTEEYVIIAGQAGVDGHLKIGKGVVISARSGVTKSLSKPGKYGGLPAKPLNENNRLSVLQHNLSEYVDKIKELEHRIAQLESN